MDDERLATANDLRKRMVNLKEAIDTSLQHKRQNFEGGTFAIVYKPDGINSQSILRFPMAPERGKELINLSIQDLKDEHEKVKQEYYNL